MPSTASIAVIAWCLVGDAASATDHVPNQRNRVDRLDVDLLSNLDRVINLDTKVANGALDLRMSEQKLDGSEVASEYLPGAGLASHSPALTADLVVSTLRAKLKISRES